MLLPGGVGVPILSAHHIPNIPHRRGMGGGQKRRMLLDLDILCLSLLSSPPSGPSTGSAPLHGLPRLVSNSSLFPFLVCSALPFSLLLSVISRVYGRKWGDKAGVLCQDFVSVLDIQELWVWSGPSLAPTPCASWVQDLSSLAIGSFHPLEPWGSGVQVLDC